MLPSTPLQERRLEPLGEWLKVALGTLGFEAGDDTTDVGSIAVQDLTQAAKLRLGDLRRLIGGRIVHRVEPMQLVGELARIDAQPRSHVLGGMLQTLPDPHLGRIAARKKKGRHVAPGSGLYSLINAAVALVSVQDEHEVVDLNCARRSKSEPKRRSVFDPPKQFRRNVAEVAEKGEGGAGEGAEAPVDMWITCHRPAWWGGWDRDSAPLDN